MQQALMFLIPGFNILTEIFVKIPTYFISFHYKANRQVV